MTQRRSKLSALGQKFMPALYAKRVLTSPRISLGELKGKPLFVCWMPAQFEQNCRTLLVNGEDKMTSVKVLSVLSPTTLKDGLEAVQSGQLYENVVENAGNDQKLVFCVFTHDLNRITGGLKK